MTYPTPTPCIEYRVQTECGRNLVWSATCLSSLMIELTSKGYRATMLMENAAYEAQQEREAQDMQREWVFDFNNVIDKEAKESA